MSKAFDTLAEQLDRDLGAFYKVATRLAISGDPCFPCNPSPVKPASKSPLTEHGYLEATDDWDQLEKWANRFPRALVGVPTGPRTRCFVLDIDLKGLKWLADIQEKYGPLPKTMLVSTPSGGRHYYFKLPAGIDIPSRSCDIADGVDIRGEGGYAIAPDSTLLDGRGWRVVEIRDFVPDGDPSIMADAPRWLVHAAAFDKHERKLVSLDAFDGLPVEKWREFAGSKHPELKPAVRSTVPLAEGRDVPLTKYVEVGADADLAALGKLAKGSRNYEANRTAYKIWRNLKGAEYEGLDISELEDRYEATFHNALVENGLETEDRGTAEDMWSRCREQATPKSLAHVGRKDGPGETQEGAGSESDGWEPFSTSMADTINDPIQPVPFVIEQWVPSGYVSLFSGDAGIGKTTTLVHASVCVTAGKPFFGLAVEQGAVLGIMSEDTPDQLRRVVQASCKHLEVSADEVAQRLFLESYLKREAALWEGKPNGKAGPTELGRKLERRLEASNGAIKLVLLDRTVDVFRGVEYDRDAVSQFMRWLTKLGAEYQVAFVLIHHESKSAGENDSHAASGSTAWRYKCKSQGRFQKVSKDVTTLKHTKHSFSAEVPIMTLQYQGGMYVSVSGDQARAAECYDLAQELMTAAIKDGESLSPSPRAPNYAPRWLITNSRACLYSEPELAQAIAGLVAAKVLDIKTYTSHGKDHQRFILLTKDADAE